MALAASMAVHVSCQLVYSMSDSVPMVTSAVNLGNVLRRIIVLLPSVYNSYTSFRFPFRSQLQMENSGINSGSEADASMVPHNGQTWAYSPGPILVILVTFIPNQS